MNPDSPNQRPGRSRAALGAAALIILCGGCDSLAEKTEGGARAVRVEKHRDPPAATPTNDADSTRGANHTADAAWPGAVDGSVASGPPSVPAAVPPGFSAAGDAPPADAAPPSPSSGQLSEQYPAVLTRAVVLPQTLPSGTQATFSANYRFDVGGPKDSYRYALAISNSAGKTRVYPVSVQKPSGVVAVLQSGFRPTEGPFRGWLVEQKPDGEKRQIAPAVTFRR